MTGIEMALAISAAAAVALSVTVLVREKPSIPAVTFAGGLLLFTAEGVLAALGLRATDPGAAVRWQQWRLIALAFAPGVWLWFSVSYSRGNYKAFQRRWLPAIAALLLAIPGIAMFFHDRLVEVTEGGVRLLMSGRIVHVALVLGATAVLVNVERTFRTSVGMMRWQLKFIVIGIGVLMLTRVYTSTQALLFSAAALPLDRFNTAAVGICAVLGFVSIKRTRSFMLDLYPAPSIRYRSFTLTLVGGYLVAVGLFARIIRYFGGIQDFPAQAFLLLLGAVALGLLILSDRVRLRTKRAASRFLRRPLYDVAKMWTTFSAATAGHVEEKELCRAAVKWLSETFEVLSVSLWLVEGNATAAPSAREAGTPASPAPNGDARPAAAAGTLRFGASTSLSEQESEALLSEFRSPAGGPAEGIRAAMDSGSEALAPAIGHLHQLGRAVNIETTDTSWARLLRMLLPPRFPRGGHRICLPIINGPEIVGVALLGDRVSGIQFSPEEFDLLNCVASQVAGEIMRIQLARRLGEAREVQAFQTVATFFVHDLKNTTWTLSLLVENLKLHFNDPAFREEAIRALSKSVNRINDLVERISSLRHKLELKREDANVSDLVEHALREFDGMSDVRLIRSLTAADTVEVDREQIHKVLVNLVLNAREACREGGEIRVSSRRQNGHVTITVEDNGVGMSAQFQKERLFRPFQTTKKKGIGIGMFQSKTIMEAHSGTIRVESEEGRGTRVELTLPLKVK